MSTIFDQKGWAPDPGVALQGIWMRLCVERPCPVVGWVAVLDSAGLRAAINAPRMPKWARFAHQAASLEPYLVEGWPCDARELQRFADMDTWTKTVPCTIDRTAPDLSAYARQWVGHDAVRGWPNDTILAAGTWALHPDVAPANIRLPIRHILTDLMEDGCPGGQGWALPESTHGQELRRDALQASAHAKLAAQRTHGTPRPWDVDTARITLALTAYATHPRPLAGAWMPRPA